MFPWISSHRPARQLFFLRWRILIQTVREYLFQHFLLIIESCVATYTPLQTPVSRPPLLHNLGPVHQAYRSILHPTPPPTATLTPLPPISSSFPSDPSALPPFPHIALMFPSYEPSARLPPPATPPAPSQAAMSTSILLQMQRDAPRPQMRARAPATSGPVPVVAACFVDGLFTGIGLEKVAPN